MIAAGGCACGCRWEGGDWHPLAAAMEAALATRTSPIHSAHADQAPEREGARRAPERASALLLRD
ncbi:hypothetical protein AAC03nite_04270 [Alicyclobacillus acidoterrestris]|uniref:hypothetical protein n=1 Tax=Alicyclobacillus suci TaxID=2816080 RepID=UPI00118EDE61|nr:hypothetical protein [Alicyclobacillus suci]GEO24642.1 hypothetical protein AAC03nite_04270 [Alicyclobacillus acidoterrestris]